MGCSSEILHMITILFMLLSSYNTHILIDGAVLNAAEDFNVHALQQLYLREDNEERIEDHIQKVSGEEREEKGALVVEKFRALLGLKSFHTRSPSHLVSPSPSPSPTIEAEASAPAPAPVPVLHVRANPHPPSHRSSSFTAHHKTQEQGKDKNRVRTILVAVIASAGAALVCALGLIFLCHKRGKQRKKPTRITSVHGQKGESRGKLMNASTKNSASKVSENPGLDLFYLNTLGTDLEQQSYYLKQTSESVNTSPYQSISKCTFHEIQEGNKELSQLTKVQSDNASTSSTREITSVHEDTESIKYESDGGNSSSGDNIIPIECHSSDDESFHSFGESFSSNVRLSNASAGSLGEASDILSSQESRLKTSLVSSLDIQMRAAIQDACSSQDSAPPLKPPQSPCKSIVGKLGVECSSDCQKLMKHQSPPPRPPPPPPPPPIMTYSPPLLTINASLSFTLPNLSSPGTSDSSSGTNRISQRDLSSSPQNAPEPSQASSRIPPPPCPPPFLKGNNSSAKCAPPPPSQALQFTPVGKDGAPLAKLKPLHWDKVRAASDRSTVWDKLRSSSFELNEEMIESLFGYNLQHLKGDEAKSKTPSPSKHVLDPKRLQNITILSKALNATAEQVCEALVQGNGLCLQQLEALVKMVPTKEEEAKLSSYKGEICELGSAEKFVKVILAIPFAFLRAEAMLYRETFEDEVVHLRNSFSMLEEACKELRSSRLFLKLLEAVLKTGNRMNVGTIRGGARAFKLDALLKLADVKGTDGKTTLLHFVVQEIIRSEGIRVSDSIMGRISQKKKTKTVEEREEDYRRMGLELVSGLSTELYNVKKTATIDLDVLASSVSYLSDGMTKLQHLIQKDLCPNEQNGNFVNSMRSFLNYAEKNLKDLQGDEDRVLKHVKEITEYFHGDVSKDEVNPLRIFVIVRDFLGMLDNVCKELRSSKAPRSPNPLAPFR
ncbi:Formin-like protein 9 [Morella rubra]|uniref:Formin-like protein n=1 Tax=Morella rubra TaxID=262757 RepID=A0A6A1UPK2_9ROSI|nr:Formin-like protein 9 [Morella rubra]